MRTICVRVCACARVHVVEVVRERESFAILSVENSFAGEGDVRETFECVRTRASHGIESESKVLFLFFACKCDECERVNGKLVC